MTETIGMRRLKKWSEDGPPAERGQGRIAKVCGVSQSAVSQWMRGETRPVADKQELIEILTGIKAHLWMTGRERQEKRKLLRAVERATEEAGR